MRKPSGPDPTAPCPPPPPPPPQVRWDVPFFLLEGRDPMRVCVYMAKWGALVDFKPSMAQVGGCGCARTGGWGFGGGGLGVEVLQRSAALISKTRRTEQASRIMPASRAFYTASCVIYR